MRRFFNSLVLVTIILTISLMLSYITLTMYNISNKTFSTAFLGGAISVLVIIRCYKFLDKYRIK